MIQFTVGDQVVVDGQTCLVRGLDDLNVRVLTPTGDYVTVTHDDITGVYID